MQQILNIRDDLFCMHMQLVNHTMSDDVLNNVLKQVSNYFDPTTIEERMIYSKKVPADKILWGLSADDGENREYLKVVAHPQDQASSNLTSLRCIYNT